ncbi:MAG TPA: ComEC/Rec2 family competence protein [Solirubrobacterales bacterium]|nr:ComEC/Rec2 family competence protein [Solirubrobacterales bacterium]
MRSPRPSLPVLIGIAVVVALALTRSGELRERAEDGLGRGMPAREAALARGFVLGQDDGVDEATEKNFRRAGLSHLLAVSGQNVMLLALLATPLLAALGIPLRERLVWLLALIAVYVPLAGAEPSIQRAAVMGGAGLVATMAGRRSSRLYALVLALLVTLAVDPGVGGDVGWRLSFTAVAGIFVLAAPLREAISIRIGNGHWRRALAEGAALTIAATLATAPLIAFHFGTLSTTTLLANLLALPAVAPAMWLGMLCAAAAQVPGLPLEPLNAVNALLLAYIAQVAEWCGGPPWAEVEVRLGAGGLIAAYVGLALAVMAVAYVRRIRSHLLPLSDNKCERVRVRPLAGALAVVLALYLAQDSVGDLLGAEARSLPPTDGLRVEMLDVGQGDAILLRPPRDPAILVDAGPPGADLVPTLDEAGVKRLGAVIVTHEQSDHSGGLGELLGRVPVERLLYARLGRDLRAEASAAGIPTARLATGDVLRSGRLRLEALWPPPALLAEPLGATDPNAQSLVLLARWRGFTMLLSGDAEAEAVPLDPGPIDLLKVAHHGSEDAGLGALLERTRPRLALISAGDDNPFGHPTAATLATLAVHGVPVLRTDEEGTIALGVTRDRLEIETED